MPSARRNTALAGASATLGTARRGLAHRALHAWDATATRNISHAAIFMVHLSAGGEREDAGVKRYGRTSAFERHEAVEHVAESPRADAVMTMSAKPTGRISSISSFLELLRNTLILLLAVYCVLHPSSIRGFLKESGLSKLEIFGIGIEVQEQKDKVEAAQKLATEVATTGAAASAGDAPVEAAGGPVNSVLKEAVLSAERIAPQILPPSGWVYLGHVDREKTDWVVGQPTTTTSHWPVKAEDLVTIKDDVYLRGDAVNGNHSAAPVLSVAKVGDRLKVVDVQFSSAKSGGWFVWAKVAVVGG